MVWNRYKAKFDKKIKSKTSAIAYIFKEFSDEIGKLMHPIDPNRVPNWVQSGERWVPTSVKTICPHCNRPSTLTTRVSYRGDQLGMQMVAMEGDCTQCDEKSMVWVVNPHRNTHSQGCSSIWMLPVPRGIKQPIQKPAEMNDRIFKAYLCAVECFNAEIWTSAINECGRVIEGITAEKFETPDDRREIGQIQSRLAQNMSVEAKLFRPILKLSHAIRLSRRSGSHFEFANDPNQDTASKVIELTEYAIEYFYGLEEKATELGAAIDRLEQDTE